MSLPFHEIDGGGPNQPLHSEEIGQSQFTVQVLDKTDPDNPVIVDKTYEDPTSLHPGKYLLGLQLNRVMNLLIEMVATLQKVAVQQSQKLSFFSQMQNANTAQMNSVHTWVLNDSAPTFISGSGDDQNTNRQSLNQSNTGYIQAIKANNDLIANTAKQIQTNVNQTQDAVSQQSNMLTSLIQQLRSINSSIGR